MFRFLTDPAAMQTVFVWVGALCTLGLYTILYRENKVFRFFEHVFLGLATGYGVFIVWTEVLRPKWWDAMTGPAAAGGGRWWWAFALPGGLLFYMIYSKRYAWTSRLIYALFFGFAAGQAFRGFASIYFPLIQSAINVPLSPALAGSVPAAINNVLYLVILAAVMSYFFFSFEQRNPAVAGASRLGRYLLMFAFGAIFGSTVMARMSLLIGRVYFLLHDWLPLAR
jgi:hypothetical protein